MDLLSQFQFSSDNRGGGVGATGGINSFISTDYNTNPQQPHVLDHPRLIRSITIDRCSNFTSGGANGNDVNLLSQLYKAKTNSGLDYL
jgi:alpha-mannosidase